MWQRLGQFEMQKVLLDKGICGRRRRWALGQGGTSQAQGTLPGAVPTNEATGMDKDAARNPTDPVQSLIPKTPPWLWQGQPTNE